MRTTRERYLDDTSRHLVRVVLETPSRETHSLISDAPDEVREQIGDVLVRALDEIQAVLAPALDQPRHGQAR